MDYEPTNHFEDKVVSLFQPDTLITDQYLSGHKSKQLDPGKRLMLAVLQDAIFCYQENVLARDAKKQALFREAEDWIMAESRDWVFSFENVCEALDLSPEYVRAGLLRFKEKRATTQRRYHGKKHKAA
jgi:hypothetical protein